MAYSQFEDLAPYYDELMNVVPYDFWAEYVMTLFDFVEWRAQNVLDCACGTGNLSYELTKYGLQVTGIDISERMISEAKAKAIQVGEGSDIEFHQGDLTNFNLHKIFDTATCLYDSLNYILSNSDLLKAFLSIRKHLIQGGIFVFDFNSVWAFEANLFTQKSRKADAPLHYEWQAHFDKNTRICTVEMSFKKQEPSGKETVFRETHKERAYSIDEIKSIAGQAGWEIVHIFDAYTLNRPKERSERWFFVAKAV